MGIALIIFLIIILLWPTIMKWVKRYMARKAEDYLRQATGMPPRPGSKQAKQQAKQQARQDQSRQGQRHSGSRQRRQQRYYGNEPLIPKEYAEDVEFTEVKSFSETTIAEESCEGSSSTSYHESQVSDVEFVEIKDKSHKN